MAQSLFRRAFGERQSNVNKLDLSSEISVENENKAREVWEGKFAAEEERMHSLLFSMGSDPKLNTLMDIFAGLLVNPNFRQFGEAINLASTSVTEIFTVSDNLRSFAGQDEIDSIYAIFTQFIALIQATQETVQNVMTQSEIQQTNIKSFLQIIDDIPQLTQMSQLSQLNQVPSNGLDANEANETKECKKEDETELTLEECIDTLVQWMSDTAITEMKQKWNDFGKICSDAHTRWVKLEQKLEKGQKKLESRQKWSPILGKLAILAGVIAVGCGIGLVLGPFMMAGIVAMGAGGVVCAAGAYGTFGYTKKLEKLMQKGRELEQQVSAMKNGLKLMLLYGQRVEKPLAQLDRIKKAQVKNYVQSLRVQKTRRSVVGSVGRIADYLQQFQKQAYELLERLETMESELVHAYGNMKM